MLLGIGFGLAELLLRIIGFEPWPRHSITSGEAQLYQPDTEIGWTLKPHSNPSAGWLIGTDGLRRVPHSRVSDGQKRILILGDSSIFGYGLSEENSFAGQLAQRLTSYEVRNAAVPGFGATQSMLLMSRLFRDRRHSHVILGYADYLRARDTGQLDWAHALAEMSSLQNVAFPFGEIINGNFSIRPSQPYFLTLPGRTVLSSVRAAECGFAALGSIRRSWKRDETEREVLLAWAKAAVAHGALPILFLWEGDGVIQRHGEVLHQAGVSPVKCVHPLLKQPAGKVDPQGHPSAMVVEWWAKCVMAAVPSLGAES